MGYFVIRKKFPPLVQADLLRKMEGLVVQVEAASGPDLSLDGPAVAGQARRWGSLGLRLDGGQSVRTGRAETEVNIMD